VIEHLNLGHQYAWAHDPVSAFLDQIQVNPVKQSRLVEVSAFSEDPVQASQMANAVIQFYVEQNLENKLEMTQQAAKWLQERIIDIRQKLAKSELQFEVVKLKKELMELNEKYLPKHPTVTRTQSRLEVLERQLGNEMKNIAPGSLPALYNQLEREVESNRKIYESMLSRLKETTAAQGLEDTNVIVIDQAEVPTKPVAPRVFLNFILSVLVGLFGGVGLCLVFESMDSTVKSPEDIEKTGLPVLGVIGKWGSRKKELIVHQDAHSVEAEYFRGIRTSLLFSSPDKPLRTILVTSPLSEDGKTLVACNVAAVIAQSGARVLLIDADMRKPRINRLLGQPNGHGLSYALTHSVNPTDLVFQTPVSNLSALFCGAIPPTPSELLGSQKMQTLLQKLREDFDYLIIDSPPFMAVTDPVVLSTIVDGVVIVTRYNKTPKDLIVRGKQKFQGVQAKLIGAIINAVDMKQEDGYYSHSYSGYGYKNEKGDKSNDLLVGAGTGKTR
jgi:capsular exopolysaccharide synthesis family protein